jgi:16S rRNA (guanine966-N2)-methyltransferase
MRIIAGEHRGRPLKSLKGDATRPTTDRVREALMSSLTSARGTLEGACVLDAFAGSGAVGLETLSRGAAHVTFCEQGRDAAKIVEENIASLGIPRTKFALRKGDAFTLPQFKGAAFDLVFLDPPYAYEASKVIGLVKELDASSRLMPGALVCYEFAKKDKQAVEQELDALEYTVVSVKDYGATSLITFRKEQ